MRLRTKHEPPVITVDPRSPSPYGIPSSVLDARSSRVSALNILLFLVILNFALQPLTEPDFGWHLRTGLDVLQNGWTLPTFDPYSHTMPQWAWVDHAWLTDVLIGGTYSLFGGLGVIVLFGAVTVAAWLLASQMASCGVVFRWIACILSLWVALPYLGARTQLITLLGLSLLLLLLKRWQAGEVAVRWWIPPLFLLWANLHGGFTAGLFLFGLIIITNAIVRWLASCRIPLIGELDEPLFSWPDLKHLIFIAFLSALVTLLNPYGWRLHGEILDSLSNQFMLDTLQEWQPLSMNGIAGRSYMLYLIGLGLTMVLWYRRIEPVRWVIGGVFLMLSLRHMRNIPLFLIISLPLFAELLAHGFESLQRRLRVGLLVRRMGSFAGAVVVGGLLFWLGPEHLQHIIHSGSRPAEYFRNTSYPIEAVEWVKTHRDLVGQRLYNDYAYGGFLLWWLPEEKIFIDGRMPAWQRGERGIFRDYVALTGGDPPDLTVLKKYSVDWVMVQKMTLLDQELAREPAWARVYEDRKVAIYLLSGQASNR
jgi:hypothetical protein